MCRAPTFDDHVYMDWFLRIIFPSIGKYVTSHFPQTEEEALQVALKYDLIYAQSSYVYTVYRIFPNLVVPIHWGNLTSPMISLDLFHIRILTLPWVMVSHREGPTPLALIPLLAACIQDKAQLI